LRDTLRRERNVYVSASTIWRGLSKAGYSFKVVSSCFAHISSTDLF
jgi:hypothetical protein